jgi:TPR repeat protein
MSEAWDSEPDLEQLHKAYGLLSTDPEQALVKLRILADRGSLMSMVYIANAYRNGIGVKVDIPQSEYWYTLAANGGSALASYELGRMFLDRNAYSKAEEFLK